MDEGTINRKRRAISRSLMAFAIFSFLSSLIGALFFDALIIDLVPVLVIWLAMSFAEGSARAAKWSRILMGYYVVVAVLPIVMSVLSPSRIKISGRALTPEELPYAIVTVSVVGLWALTNFLLLWKYRREFSTDHATGGYVS